MVGREEAPEAFSPQSAGAPKRQRQTGAPGWEIARCIFRNAEPFEVFVFWFPEPTPGRQRAERISTRSRRVGSGSGKNHPRLLGLILKVK